MVLGTGLGIVGYWLTVGRRRRADVPVKWFPRSAAGFHGVPAENRQDLISIDIRDYPVEKR
jgi:hypothetical protein